MPYINYSDTKGYYPSESLQNLFEKTIVTPFRKSLPEEAYEYEMDINWEYKRWLRETVLKRGSTDFDQDCTPEDAKNYTPEDKVLLYCATYMPMHLYSGYNLYSKYLRQQIAVIESKNVVFIDFGCGPLTSGIAFWAAAGQCNITYIGIERSKYMLDIARKILRYGPGGSSRHPFFNKAHSSRHHSDLRRILDSIEKDNDTLIIFNFSYVLAPTTFQGDINELINVLRGVVQANHRYKIAMVYQNVEGGDKNWKKLKKEVSEYPYFLPINFTSQNDTETVFVKYERLMEKTVDNNLKVSYDYFYNW